MPDLRLVAVSEDGAHLVLRGEDGKKYTLPVDERLRAAVRGDRIRLGQIEIEMESQLRPRDIQARIRAGATAEEVAVAAGLPVDRVKRFEGPVLAERAYMAERARKTPVRRQGESTGPLLGDLVHDGLIRYGVDPEEVVWDSWRRDNGCWEVVLEYPANGTDGQRRSARWTFDPPRRLVLPEDDDAHLLTGEQPHRPEPALPFVPRLATAGDQNAALPSTSGMPGRSGMSQPPAPPAVPVAPEDNPHHIERVARSVVAPPDYQPGHRQGQPPNPLGSPGAPNRFVPPAPPAAGLGGPRDGLGVPRDGLRPPGPRAMPLPPDAEDGPVPGPPTVSIPPLRRTRREASRQSLRPHLERLTGSTDRQAENDGVRPGRRATVPSWDEIVFGSRRKNAEEH